MTRADDTPVPNYADRLRLDGKRFVVIGAGQGIGRQATHALAQQGAKVLCDIQKGGGSWGGGTVDTCFAILFLKRATRPLDMVATESASQMRAKLNQGGK